LYRNRGWLTPGWWDDDSISDPTSDPRDLRPVIDEIAIERVLAGDESVTLTRPERVEAVRQLSRRGAISPTEIATRLRMSGTRVQQLLERPLMVAPT
jgi:hypothetical protein